MTAFRQGRGRLAAIAGLVAFAAAACSSTVDVSTTSIGTVPSLAGLPSAAAFAGRTDGVLALALAIPISCASGDSGRVCTAQVNYTDTSALVLHVSAAGTDGIGGSGAAQKLATTDKSTDLELAPGQTTTVPWTATTAGSDDLTGVSLVYGGYRYAATADGATATPVTAGSAVSASPSAPSSPTGSPEPTPVPTPTPPSPRAAKVHPSAPPKSTYAPTVAPPGVRTFPVAPPVRRSNVGGAPVSATIG